MQFDARVLQTTSAPAMYFQQPAMWIMIAADAFLITIQCKISCHLISDIIINSRICIEDFGVYSLQSANEQKETKFGRKLHQRNQVGLTLHIF